MYSITNVIFGIPLNTPGDGDPKTSAYRLPNPDKSDELELALADEQPEGFYSFYHGGSDIGPHAFGVLLGAFDECHHHLDVDKLTLKATPAQIAEFNQMLADLDDDLRKEVEAYGEPRTFLLFSTS